jgi:hypothetical protein
VTACAAAVTLRQWWRLEAGGWRLEAGGWRLEAGGGRMKGRQGGGFVGESAAGDVAHTLPQKQTKNWPRPSRPRCSPLGRKYVSYAPEARSPAERERGEVLFCLVPSASRGLTKKSAFEQDLFPPKFYSPFACMQTLFGIRMRAEAVASPIRQPTTWRLPTSSTRRHRRWRPHSSADRCRQRSTPQTSRSATQTPGAA